ncbi:MFS transporter [Actinorhabdospora filicis]|nr:MFS transporter [Actinorhabdospora filicis]
MSKRDWGVLFVLCGAIFLEGIDVAMLNVALPAIRADLGMSTGGLQWVMSAYVLGYGGFMLLGGRAADLFGRRRMFVLWLTVFIAFSGLGGFASEPWMLIAARFVTGVAAAFMTPAGLSIITTSIEEGAKRDKALLIYSGTAAGGFSVGLVIGGLLTTVDWRLVFFAPVALAVVILVAALALVPKADAPERSGNRIDLAGAVSVTAAIVLLVLGVERAAGAPVVQTVATVAAGLLALALFAAIERKVKEPLVRLSILRDGRLLRGNLAAMLFAGAFAAFQFTVVLFLQELRGWSSLQASLAMLVIGIDVILAPTLTAKLVARFGNARVAVGGLAAAALGYAAFLPVAPDWTYAAMLPSFLLIGLAFSLAYGPLTIAATEGVPEADQGLAGGLFYTAFQFGTALGLAVATTANVALGGSSMLDGLRGALVVPVAMAVLAAVIAVPGARSRREAVAVA